VASQPRKDGLGVAHDGDVHPNVLRDARRIDIDVNHPGLGSEAPDVAGDAVVEPHADGDQKVALLNRVVGVRGSVHAEHVQRLGQGLLVAAQSHQRHGDGQVGPAGQLSQLACGVAADDSATGQEDGALSPIDGFGGTGDLCRIADGADSVAGQIDLSRSVRLPCGEFDVHRKVDQDRAGPTGRGDVESLVDRASQVLDVLDDVVVFRDGTGDPDHGGFLEGVAADQVGSDLPGDGNQRDRIHHRGGQTRNEIARAGSAGGDNNARPAAGTGVGVGHVAAALLVTGYDETNRRCVQTIEQRQHGGADVAENGVDTMRK